MPSQALRAALSSSVSPARAASTPSASSALRAASRGIDESPSTAPLTTSPTNAAIGTSAHAKTSHISIELRYPAVSISVDLVGKIPSLPRRSTSGGPRSGRFPNDILLDEAVQRYKTAKRFVDALIAAAKQAGGW